MEKFREKNILKKMKKLARIFRDGSVQMWRNGATTAATILLGALILFLLNFVFSVKFLADAALKNLESRADFAVILRENFDMFNFGALKNEISQNSSAKIKILPAENLGDFSVPSRIFLKFKNLREIFPVFEILKKPRYDNVVGNWDTGGEREFVEMVEKILWLRDSVEKISVILFFIFFGGGILLAINNFRITIFARREEIFIARIVGAAHSRIVAPFLIEGILLGIFSSIVGIVIFVAALREIEIFPGGEIFIFFWNKIFSLEILAATAVGAIGAGISARKFLHEKFDF